ncbi:hypothetical protein LINPERPRIM_LOCUS16960 [Linum perenne]
MMAATYSPTQKISWRTLLMRMIMLGLLMHSSWKIWLVNTLI